MGFLRTFYFLYKLQKNQWLSSSDLDSLQNKKLRAIVKHAYNGTKFYHQMFDSVGIKPEEIKTKEDLMKLPIITREDVRKNFPNRIVAENVDLKKCFESRTSGSTGEPLTSIFDGRAWDFAKYAVKIRERLACGLRPGDRMIKLLTAKREVLQREEKQLSFRLWNLFLKRKQLSIFDDIRDHLPVFEKFQPDAMDGHPSYFKLLAHLVKRGEIRDLHPRILFTSSELLDRTTRELISTAFGAELFDIYGCVELKDVAWECGKHVGYHINVDSVIVEFIRNGESVSAGEEGEIVLTGLYNYAMPLIRYKVGDVGVPTDELCPCGRGLPLMKVVEGRLVDFIALPSGRVISPIAMAGTMTHIPGIIRWQIVQEKKDKIVVRFMKEKDFSQRTINQIIDKLQRTLKEEVEIEPVLVKALPRDGSRKFRVVLSKVPVRL